MSEAVATAVRTEASLVARRMSSRASTLVGSARATVSTSWARVTGTALWRRATLRGSTARVSSAMGMLPRSRKGRPSWSERARAICTSSAKPRAVMTSPRRRRRPLSSRWVRRASSSCASLRTSPAPSTSTLAAMKLGLAVPHYDISFPDRQPATFDRIARYAELGESLGFFQLWVSDHFWLDLERYGGPAGRQGTPECWTILSALAVRTSRIRLGSLVLAAGFRPPTLLAKMAATLDQLSGGRLDLGLGAGWNQAEFAENGLPFPRPGERLAMLEETLEVLDRLLGAGGEPASFRGRFFTADQAPVLPGPVQRPRPPLWVGGRGDRLLGVVARAADGWNICWSVTEADYQ